MSLDISRIDGLSSAGLLADRIRVEISHMSTGSIDCEVFAKASRYFGYAIRGIEQINSLVVDQNTVFAVDAFETVVRAVPQLRPEDIEQITETIGRLKDICEKLSRSENVDQAEIECLESFFSSLSRYTREERSLILQQSSVSAFSSYVSYA